MITQEAATTLDLKALAKKTVTNAFNLLFMDLDALPEEAFNQSFGEKTRTVADVVYETILVNERERLSIRGEEAFEWPDDGWVKAPADFRTKDAVTAGLKACSEKVMGTIEGFTPEQLVEKITTDGGETTRFGRCQFMALHMWYHSGQLNYIQTLRGDDAWHWG